MKFKVTFQLMIEPTKNDATFNRSYEVEAENKREAIEKAESLKDETYDDEYGYLSQRSVFNYSVKNI